MRNKDALLILLADRIASEAYAAGTSAPDRLPPEASWQQRVEAQLAALRHTLRKHAGGPFLLATSPATLSRGALSLMERLLSTLCEANVAPEHRPIAADTLLSYVTGFVLQEQSEATSPQLTADDVAELTRHFPLTMKHGPEYEPDEMSFRSLRLQCAAIATVTQ